MVLTLFRGRLRSREPRVTTIEYLGNR